MTFNLQSVVRDIIGMETGPSRALFAGDLSYLQGLKQDYLLFNHTIEPLRVAGLHVDLTLGNHDHRENFYAVMSAHGAARTTRLDRHASVIESPYVNWLMLDSLEIVDATPGVIGPAQLAWLDAALAKRSGRPAVVVAHHNLDAAPPAPGQDWFGLRDGDGLLAVLTRHRHVMAYMHGHTHRYSIARHGSLHVINLPPTAYVFEAGAPTGWVDVRASGDGIVLTLQCIDTAHAEHGRRFELGWPKS